jgi:hypothetical protein
MNALAVGTRGEVYTAIFVEGNYDFYLRVGHVSKARSRFPGGLIIHLKVSDTQSF